MVTHLGLGKLRLSPIRKRSKGRNRDGSLCQGGESCHLSPVLWHLCSAGLLLMFSGPSVHSLCELSFLLLSLFNLIVLSFIYLTDI